ncbi:TonB-dependent receptor [Microbulbifer bruguierae]|uniref:TonB-dependent receptor n=1 Tax=Microbulbifer bruguierae TaxID=3029061 RepID=A0ABY8NA30_9GAMM|nr:TonB-dependent receptor [Microbulbifer bruguierae]WGL15764.1 TonB-dependent receptor [Microbulbifer bruguierae]
MSNHNHHTHASPRPRFSKRLLALTIASVALNASLAQAQDGDEQEKLEEVTVTGTLRDTMRNSIDIKRDAETIVDVISSAEMGSLPDLSVAETLERIVGVTGDRFKGNASEISVRGLGPFLGYSTYNGREISSGSGNRAVAFSQFPSELVNGATVYKSQSANLLEGAVAGLIDLQSIRPIDYGKRRFQAEVKGNYNEYDAKLNGDSGTGYRSSISYTDVFDTSIGTVGFAIGYTGDDASSPEESFNTSSTLRNCNSNAAVDGGSNCSWSDDNSAAGGGMAADGDYYFIPNSFYFRQMESEETRDAVMTTLQWQPSDAWNITLDAQWSDRFYYEDRHDLYFDDGRRRISNWSTNKDHALTSYTGESRVSTYGEFRERDEVYEGTGLNIEWAATDKLVLNTDLSYSSTTRYQETWQTRFRSDRVWYDYDGTGTNGDLWPTVNIYEDRDNPSESLLGSETLQDYSFYDANQRARYGEFEIKDKIKALAFEGIYDLDWKSLTSVEAGVRFSSHEHKNYDEDQIEFTDSTYADISTVAQECGTDYPQSGFGEDANSSFDQWATYDTRCAYDLMLGDVDWAQNPQAPSAADVNLTEKITSAFVKINFYTQLGGIDVSGNVGVRAVQTDLESVGYRQSYSVTNNDAGTPDNAADDSVLITELQDSLTKETYSNQYVNILPSVNVNFALTESVQLRTALYSAISRPDMWWMGAGRELDLGDGEEEFSSIQAAIDSGSVTALGNPNLEAIESQNFDLSLAWYPTDETMLAAAYYLKNFSAGLEVADSDTVAESFDINGADVTMNVEGLVQNTSDSSRISGVELTAQHAFANLPGALDGLGVSAGLNIADTDFDYLENGADITDDLVIPAANLPGFSKKSYNAEVYWENYGITSRLSYKYRSDYLKPFGSDFGQTNRFVDDTSSVDLSLSYQLGKNLRLQLQALNLTNEPYTEYRVAQGSYNRVELGGTRYFLGLRYKL